MQTLTKKPMKLPPRNAMVQLTDPDTGKARKMKPLGQATRRIYSCFGKTWRTCATALT